MFDMENILRQSAANYDERKLFVGGLSWKTTSSTFKDYFTQFGEVEECLLMINPKTKRPRGFGFVTFKSQEITNQVLKIEHLIDGKPVEVKKSTPKNLNKIERQFEDHKNLRKVFVGGLPTGVSESYVHAVFEMAFGAVEEVVIMCQPAEISTQNRPRSRGFGFITFESEMSAHMAVNQHYHIVGGKAVEIKRAEPKNYYSPTDTCTQGIIDRKSVGLPLVNPIAPFALQYPTLPLHFHPASFLSMAHSPSHLLDASNPLFSFINNPLSKGMLTCPQPITSNTYQTTNNSSKTQASSSMPVTRAPASNSSTIKPLHLIFPPLSGDASKSSNVPETTPTTTSYDLLSAPTSGDSNRSQNQKAAPITSSAVTPRHLLFPPLSGDTVKSLNETDTLKMVSSFAWPSIYESHYIASAVDEEMDVDPLDLIPKLSDDALVSQHDTI